MSGQIRRFKRYPAYKDSGVEWLGEIPAHWDARKVKRLCLVKRGASPRPIEDPMYFDDDGEYAWVRISDVTASERYLEVTTQKLSSLGKTKSVALEPGELFLSIAATIGKPIITKIKCCIHDGFVYFVDLRENREFLYYIFSGGEPYKGLGKHGTQLNLNTDTIGDIYLPLAPRKEQEQVVRFLDGETARIDALVTKKERVIELLQEKRNALIELAVRGDFRDAETKLGYHVDFLTGYAFPSDGFTHDPDDIRLLRGVNISPGAVRWEETVYWPSADAARFLLYELQCCDLVFGMDRPWIESGIRVASILESDVPSLLLQRVARLRARSGLSQRYLRLVLSSRQFRSYFEPILTGVSVPHVSPEQILSFRVRLPSIGLQEERVASVEKEDARLVEMVARLKLSIERAHEMRAALISAAVTGKIDVREEVA